MGTLSKDPYFFDQSTSLKVRRPRRRKKLQDFSDDAIKDASNPELVQTEASSQKQGNGSDVDLQRLLFDQAKQSSSDLLTQLSVCLDQHDRFDDRQPVLPWTLKRQLNAGWSDLTADTQYVKREWQRHTAKRRLSLLVNEIEHVHRDSSVLAPSPNARVKLNSPSIGTFDYDGPSTLAELKDDLQLNYHHPLSAIQSSGM